MNAVNGIRFDLNVYPLLSLIFFKLFYVANLDHSPHSMHAIFIDIILYYNIHGLTTSL